MTVDSCKYSGLKLGESLFFDLRERKITLVETDNFSKVSLVDLYSYIKQLWYNEPDLIFEDLPLLALFPTVAEFSLGWDFADDNSAEMVDYYTYIFVLDENKDVIKTYYRPAYFGDMQVVGGYPEHPRPTNLPLK
jgi:hypothetical protein